MERADWTGKGYPRAYVENFETPDWSAVSRVEKHIKKVEPGVIGVVLTHGDGESHVAVRYGGEVNLDKGVNWLDPTMAPADYEEYARSTFYSLNGPEGRQTTRARMLAEQLGVELHEVKKR